MLGASPLCLAEPGGAGQQETRKERLVHKTIPIMRSYCSAIAMSAVPYKQTISAICRKYRRRNWL